MPATAPMVEEFLATTPRARDEVVAKVPHLGRECTVEQAAVNAVMAGCRPDYFPVVLAAWDALMTERTVTGGGWQSTSGPAPLIVVNGPIRGELGVNSAGGVLGPGFRANTTIARAIGLVVRNVFGIRPQELDQSTQGVPGRWTLCVGENEEEARGSRCRSSSACRRAPTRCRRCCCARASSSTTGPPRSPRKCSGYICDTVARIGAAIVPYSSAGLVLGVEHAQQLADAGFSKADVQQWLSEHAVRDHADLGRAGKSIDGSPRTSTSAGCAWCPTPPRSRSSSRARATRRCRWSCGRSASAAGRASRSSCDGRCPVSADALENLRQTLAADDYRMAVAETAAGIEVRITAGPDTCADCLVPKPLMRSILHDALGVPDDAITLVYPSDGAC